MFGKLWKKCVNYETISYLVCGVLTTAVDFVSYTLFRKMSMGVGVSQAFSWLAAVLFAYIVNKIIVFRNFNMRPSYLLKRGRCFFCGKSYFRSGDLDLIGSDGEAGRRQRACL